MNKQQKENKEVLMQLISATSQEEVSHLIDTHPFFKSCKWRPYGDNPFNGGTIKGQAPDPIGALVEKITNGIDALLTKMCWDSKIDPTSSAAPQNQYEAIKKFFGENVAKFSLTDKEVREIASQTVQVFGEGTAEKLTLSVVDFGEGQHSPMNL